jgi:hypothetical protein
MSDRRFRQSQGSLSSFAMRTLGARFRARIPWIRVIGSLSVATGLSIACHDVDTSPGVINSVEFVRLAAPSVVEGDTLRDTLGIVRPLQGAAFNIQGDLLPDAPIRFRALDTGVVVDSVTGILVGSTVSSNPIRLIVDARGLQTQPQTIFVVPRPDTVSVVTTDGLDSVQYTFRDTVLFSNELQLRVSHRAASELVGVRSYIVSFALDPATDTLLAQLVDGNNRTSLIDTTDADGVAGRRIRVRPPQLTTGTDSVVVFGTVKYRGVELPGSPIRFVLQIKPQP